MAVNYLIGVDGGGSGTRVAIADIRGRELCRVDGGPSALGLGIAASWDAITHAIAQGFADLSVNDIPYEQCAIGLGLSGVHNALWAKQFMDAAPAFASVRLETDGFTTLLGAHLGTPGAIVAVGTGLVGEAWLGGEEKRTVSAWGFPSGDEGSGAWIGLKAAQLAEKALDGRAARGPLAQTLIDYVGGSADQLFAWLGQAKQTTYAQLAPMVLKHGHDDSAASAILHDAGKEIAQVAQALDARGELPLALCGGLADALRPWLPDNLNKRAIAPRGDSTTGALRLIQERIHG